MPRDQQTLRNTWPLGIQVPLGEILAFFKKRIIASLSGDPHESWAKGSDPKSTCLWNGGEAFRVWLHPSHLQPPWAWECGSDAEWGSLGGAFLCVSPASPEGDPEEVHDLQEQPNLSSSMGTAGDTGVPTAAEFSLNTAFDAWVRRDSYWCAWKMTIKMQFCNKRISKSRPVFVLVSQGHAGSSWGVSSREITAEPQGSISSIPSWSQEERGGCQHRFCFFGLPWPLPAQPLPWQSGAAEGAQGQRNCLHIVYSSVITCLGGRNVGHSLEPRIGLFSTLQSNTTFCQIAVFL